MPVYSIDVYNRAVPPQPPVYQGTDAQGKPIVAPPPGPAAAPMPWELMTPSQQRAASPVRLNPRTGLPMTPMLMGDIPIVDAPFTGAKRAIGGVERIGGAENARDVAGGTSDVIRGTLEAATPLLPGAFAGAPLATALTLGTGTALSGGTEFLLNKLGLPKEYSALASDLIGLYGAHKAYEKLQGIGQERATRAATQGPAPAPSPEAAAAEQVIEQGRRYGVRLSAGDVSQSPGLKNVEVAAEKVPGVGMGGFREGQQIEAKAAAGRVTSQLQDALIEAEPSALTDLQDAAEGGDQRARNVLEKMNAAGNDPDRVIQASIGLGDWTTRQRATELYDKVQKLAEDHNLGDVPMNATGKAIGSSLEQLRPAKLPNKEVIGLLAKIKESISPKVDEEGNPLLDDQGSPVGPNNSYSLIRQLHSDLGERIREYYQGNNALIGEKGVGYLERVQNALEDDMRNYAKNSGVSQIVEAGDAADQYYKSARVPYKNGMLAAAATSTEPDQIFQQFIKEGKGDRAQNFYEALDDRGKAAVRYNMVRKAVDDAINPQNGIFSPQKFFTSVDKLDEAYGVFFNAKDKAEIQGFKNLMGHITRAGQYAENPPTGQRIIPYLVGGAIVKGLSAVTAHPVLTGATAGLIAGARGLFTTVKGRDLLLQLSGLKEGTPLMDSVWQRIGKELRPPEKPPEPPPAGGAPPPPPGGGGAAPPGAGAAPAGPGGGGPGAPPAAPAGGGAAAAPEGGEGQASLYERLKAQGDAALDRIRKRGSYTGERANALPIPDMKDMTIWAASRIGQGVVDPAALRKEIVAQFGKLPMSAVREIAGQAHDQELKNVRDYRLGMPLGDIHPLTSETIPLNPEVEPGLSKKKTRLYSGHEQGTESRIWTPEREAAEGPLATSKSPSQLSYIDVAPEDVEGLKAGEKPGEKGRKLMVYSPGQDPERATGLLTEDVQRYLQDMVRKRLGEVPDDAPDNVKMRRLLRYGRGEFKEQLGMPYSGVDWYGPDTVEGDRLLRQQRPELADPDFDTIQKAMSAAMSNNSNPQEEAFNGARIWEEAFDKWKRNPKSTLQFPAFQPDGKTSWPAQGAGFQIAKLNQMIKELGVHGAAEFLRDPQVPGRNIKHFVPNAKEIRLDEHFPGSIVLGPKIGVYFNQIMNIPQPGSVVDVWMMRRMGRLLGNLFDTNGKEIDAPRTEGERNLSMDMDARLGREHELATRDAQSVGWHYEQELYRRLGLNVKSFRRSDGIRKYLDSLGIK
jgi:hypothetical protein